MKGIYYDVEGDLLSITFTEADGQKHTGIALSDNIVLYYNPETEQPLQLLLLSYQGMLQASKKTPILLDGLNQAPVKVKATITTLLKRAPLTAFLQLNDAPDNTPPTTRLHEIFTLPTLQTISVS